MILACDSGGTKTNLALVEATSAGLRIIRLETYRSREYASLDEIVATFVGANPPRLQAAGFGIAGPVLAGRVETTNLPWRVDGARLARGLALGRVALMNDVEAHAWSVVRLGEGDWVTLQAGTSGPGNIGLVAAGTGLGFAALARGGGPVHSIASEGGHADFAPGDEAEIELLRRLKRRLGHVSVERVVSGPGLLHFYEFLRDQDPGEEPGWFAAALREGDPSAAVAEAALQGRSELAEKAVLLFLGAYGAEAGNWALRIMATGGVWLGGGVARKLLLGPPGTPGAWRARARAAFLSRFCGKGRLSSLLETIPVRVIENETAPLLGAAHVALVEDGR